MEKTPRQLWNDTEKWISANPKACEAFEKAANVITDNGDAVPMQFLAELARYNNVLGEATMHRLVNMFAGLEFAGGDYAIPNAVIAGVSRVLKKRDSTLNIRTSRSKLDDLGVPDALI